MSDENTATISVGHLFAGIDGFGLGLEAAGPYETAFTVEFADFPHGILKQRVNHGAEHFRDVRDVTDPPKVRVLTGGFPCQDLSLAGKGAGIGGSRSGLWTEYARIIAAVEPDVVLIENVPALLRRGFELVVDNLVELGYAVEWDCLPAAAFGAPHLRDRVFVVAHHGERAAVFGEEVPALFPVAWRELPTRDDGWQTWHRAGFVRGDELTDLEPLAPISEVRSAERVGVPTPGAMDATSGHTGRADSSEAGTDGRHSLALAHMANRGDLPDARVDVPGTALLPAPTARDEDQRAARLWPTPKASPSGPDYARVDREESAGDDLATAVAREDLLPTPTASNTKAHHRRTGGRPARSYGTTGQLNPDWVEWLMGFPIGWTNPAVGDEELIEWPWHEGEPPSVARVARDIPHRTARLTALGNALVPPAAAWLGARILPLLEESSTG